MLNDLVITFQPATRNRTDSGIHDAIERLGDATELFRDLWYVDSSYSAEQAADQIRALMDNRDRLVVIDTTNNELAWFNLDKSACKRLQALWHA